MSKSNVTKEQYLAELNLIIGQLTTLRYPFIAANLDKRDEEFVYIHRRLKELLQQAVLLKYPSETAIHSRYPTQKLADEALNRIKRPDIKQDYYTTSINDDHTPFAIVRLDTDSEGNVIAPANTTVITH